MRYKEFENDAAVKVRFEKFLTLKNAGFFSKSITDLSHR